VSRSVTNKLVEDFARSEYCPRENSPGIPSMTPEEHILSFLWYAIVYLAKLLYCIPIFLFTE